MWRRVTHAAYELQICDMFLTAVTCRLTSDHSPDRLTIPDISPWEFQSMLLKWWPTCTICLNTDLASELKLTTQQFSWTAKFPRRLAIHPDFCTQSLTVPQFWGFLATGFPVHGHVHLPVNFKVLQRRLKSTRQDVWWVFDLVNSKTYTADWC